MDLWIKNGTLLDGTGAPPRTADLAIEDGKVVALGRLDEVEGGNVLDARGKIVAPGFVDIHSHGDLLLAWRDDRRLELVEGRLAQGITTEVVGNCGLGAAPLFGPARELLPQINGWMSPAAFEWSWSDLDGYFRHLEALGLPLNVGSLVAHGPLRLGAMGLSAGESDREQRERMREQLKGALEQGALGLSVGLIYPPGMYSSTEELAELAASLPEGDRVFTSHIRGSSETLLPAVEELVTIGRRSGARVHHSHAETVGRSHWSKLERFLEKEEEARAEGVRLSADMFPYPVAATMMLAIYPPWSLEGGLSRLLDRLRDGRERRRIRHDIETHAPEWPPWQKGGWPHNLVKAVGWDRILVSSVASDKNKIFEGRSLAELGESQGMEPFEAISDLMLEEGGNVGQFVLDITGDRGLSALVARDDIAFITDANDYGKGKPHPAAYGCFPRILGHYAREKSLLSLSEAIRRMTSLPASILGLKDRGRLDVGAPADVVIFDAETIRDRATLEHPRQRAEGVEKVLVNGETVYANGKLTGALPGRILRSG